MKRTGEKNNPRERLFAAIILLIFCFVLMIPLCILLTHIYNTPITETGFFQNDRMKYMAMLPVVLIMSVVVISTIGTMIGTIKGIVKIKQDDLLIKKNNPYIYYRELPNNFGIGISTLLLNSEIENYKDIVATILDLCAKKYLHLEKINDSYIIKILKAIDDKLFSNEKYIMELIENNDLANIDYKKWYMLCVDDGINMGLYVKRNNFSIKETSNPKSSYKKTIKISLIISSIFAILSIILLHEEYGMSKIIIMAISTFLTLFFVIFFVIMIISTIIFGIKSIFKIGKEYNKIAYNSIINSQLKITALGKQELQKMYAFKDFIKEFGYFVDKKPEEVLLWDRYISYAQLFGLTKEIMKTGYSNLVKNASFIIDDIDNINLNNIVVDN